MHYAYLHICMQSWTKLTGSDSASDDVAWPVGRDGHASCLLAGTPNPQVLISGGWDKDNKLINDAWILTINERMWKEVKLTMKTFSIWKFI